MGNLIIIQDPDPQANLLAAFLTGKLGDEYMVIIKQDMLILEFAIARSGQKLVGLTLENEFEYKQFQKLLGSRTIIHRGDTVEKDASATAIYIKQFQL